MKIHLLQDEQRHIVTYLDSFSLTRDLRQARLASLPAHAFGRLQSRTEEELDALLPQGWAFKPLEGVTRGEL